MQSNEAGCPPYSYKLNLSLNNKLVHFANPFWRIYPYDFLINFPFCANRVQHNLIKPLKKEIIFCRTMNFSNIIRYLSNK
jgi:hypothetical protein